MMAGINKPAAVPVQKSHQLNFPDIKRGANTLNHPEQDDHLHEVLEENEAGCAKDKKQTANDFDPPVGVLTQKAAGNDS